MLCGRTLSDLVTHMEFNGLCSTMYHRNVDAALSWCNKIFSQLEPDDPLQRPFPWISSMLSKGSSDRPTASSLLDSMKEGTDEREISSDFIGVCCEELGFSTDSEPSSDFEDRPFSIE